MDKVKEIFTNIRHDLSAIQIGLLALALFALRLLYLGFFHPLAKYPGPFLAKFTDGWKFIQAWNYNWAPSIIDAHQKYGPIVRIAPNELSLNLPEELKQVYGLGSKFLKGPFYAASHFGSSESGHTVFSTTSPEIHQYLRRMMGAPYNITFLQSLEGFCDEHILLVEDLLKSYEKEHKTFDMSELIAWYAFDTAAQLGFSRSYGFLANGEDKENLIPSLGSINHFCTCLGGSLTSIGWMFPRKPSLAAFGFFSRLFGDKNSDPTRLFALSAQMSLERIQRFHDEKKEAGETSRDMLSRMIGQKDPKTGEDISVVNLIGAGLNVIAAGGDTTRTSTNAVIRYIYEYPDVLKKCRAEISQALDEGKLSFPAKYADASQLEYIQSCMREALRMHPATGMSLQRIVPPGGAVFAGQNVPEGCYVGMLPSVIHQNKLAYGEDAHQFKPERWMCSAEKRKELDQYFLTFGQGSRICLGRHISIMEITKLLPFLIWHYDIEFDDPNKVWHVEESWFRLQTQFNVRATRREGI